MSYNVLSRSKLWIMILGLLAAMPILIPTFPPLIDLPAHLSRYHVQESLGTSQYLHRYFEYSWRFMPNLAVDILVVPLSKIFGLETSVSLVVAAIPAIAVGAMLWITIEEYGHIPPTAYAALPLSLGYPLVFGFVNSCLAVSLALSAFAFWLRLTRQGRIRTRTCAFFVIAPVLLTAHLIGYGVFGLLVGGSIVGKRVSVGTLKKLPTELLHVGVLLGWPLIITLLWRTGTVPVTDGWFPVERLFLSFAATLRVQYAVLDLGSLLVVVSVVSLPIFLRSVFCWNPVLAFPATFIWIAVIILPHTLFGSSFASSRLICVALAISVLAVRPKYETQRILAYSLISFFMFRVLITLSAFVEADNANQRDLEALKWVRQGSRIAGFVIMDCERKWAPPLNQHLTSFATTRRDAFVNDQFALEAAQGLTIKSGKNLQPIYNAVVFAPHCDRWVTPSLDEALGRVQWETVDYLWLIDAPPSLRPRQTGLKLVWQNESSVLYRVLSPPIPTGAVHGQQQMGHTSID